MGTTKLESTKNWGESITLDAWGNLTNRTVTKCSVEPLSVVALSTNRLSGYGYDAAGNMTSNGGASYTYNAENQLTTASGVTYSYDGDGNRVKKSNGTLYWGAGPMLESDLSGNLQREFIFANGKRVARRDISGGAVYYYFTDHLGSSDAVTNSSGVIQNESDYYPYGGERAYTQTLANQNYKFTGKERDTESGLDNFGARYDASSLGRFMTPDSIAYSRLDDPQSLNLYSYVGNNPTTYIDPDGHCWPQWLCNIGQRIANWSDGEGFRTNKQVDSTSPANDPRAQRRRQQEIAGNSSTQGSWFAATGMAFARWGRLGGPQHRAAVQALSRHWEAQGYKVENEKFIRTRGGAKSYRFADVYGTKTNPDGTQSVRVGQIGRTYADGKTPIGREQSALNDIKAAEPNDSVEFYDYQAPFPSETGIPGWPVSAEPVIGIPEAGEGDGEVIDPEIIP